MAFGSQLAETCPHPSLSTEAHPPPAEACRKIFVEDDYGFVVLDAEGVVRYANRAALDLLGYTADQTIGRHMSDFVDEPEHQLAAAAMAEMAVPAEDDIPLVMTLLGADGRQIHVEVGGRSYLDDPEVGAIVLRLRGYESQRCLENFFSDIVASAPLEENLTSLVQSVRHVLRGAEVAIAHHWDGSGFGSAVTTSLPSLLTGAIRLEGADQAVTPWARAITTGRVQVLADLSTLPRPLRHAAEQRGLASCWALPITVPYDDAPLAALVVWRPVASPPMQAHLAWMDRVGQAASLAFERDHTEQVLVRAATIDSLTGIANRAHFFSQLEDAMRSGPSGLAVLYLDLDGFKPVNDTHGHRLGDRLLTAVARALQMNVRPGDLVARLGGDEFAVLCPGVVAEAEATSIANRLIKVVAAPLAVDGVTVRVGLSVGIAFARRHGLTYDSLLDAADRALYRAKRRGKGRWQVAADPILV